MALEQALDPSLPDRLIAATLPLAPGDSGGPVLDAGGEVVGVAVAAQVAQAHGGRLELHAADPGGLRVELWLALERSPAGGAGAGRRNGATEEPAGPPG